MLFAYAWFLNMYVLDLFETYSQFCDTGYLHHFDYFFLHSFAQLGIGGFGKADFNGQWPGDQILESALSSNI